MAHFDEKLNFATKRSDLADFDEGSEAAVIDEIVNDSITQVTEILNDTGSSRNLMQAEKSSASALIFLREFYHIKATQIQPTERAGMFWGAQYWN